MKEIAFINQIVSKLITPGPDWWSGAMTGVLLCMPPDYREVYMWNQLERLLPSFDGAPSVTRFKKEWKKFIPDLTGLTPPSFYDLVENGIPEVLAPLKN